MYPFTFNISDPLLNSVVKLFNDQKAITAISQFFQELNLSIKRISFYDFPSITFRSISRVLESIHKMNRDWFIRNKMKVHLYVWETKLTKEKEYETEYQNKFPLNIKILKPEFETILKALIEDIKIKTYRKTHDIKFAIIIDNYEAKVSSSSNL